MLLVEFLFNKQFYLSTFNLHLGLPLSKRFQLVSHLIHGIKVRDIELLGNLVSALLNQLLEVNLCLLSARYLRLQELL